MIKFLELGRWQGTIDRGPYAAIGLLGFAVKCTLDWAVASLLFDRPWRLWSYIAASDSAVRITALSGAETLFFATMVGTALPFIWVGVVLTLRRLRSVALPTWLVVIFFLPVINLIMFAVLSVLPARQPEAPQGTPPAGRISAGLGRVIPDHPLGNAAMAIGFTVLFGLLGTMLGVFVFGRYGWGVFLGLPFCLGLVSVLIYGYDQERTYGGCMKVACLSVVLLAAALVLLWMEGVLCLLMAAPLGILLAVMGGTIGYFLLDPRRTRGQATGVWLVLILIAPALMGAEHLGVSEAPLVAVHTVIDVDATPAVVWRHVVTFPDLPEPTEIVFRLGIAYPMKARIEGQGAGAVRYCVFSTGAFVEPIEVWDEARLLRFSVALNPDPMRELTPYHGVRPPHLDGYLKSERGQFLLVELPDGRTRLEGRTWYRNSMWPASYWKLWSDFLIQRIHLRVLTHIKGLAEQQAAGNPGEY